MFLEKTCCKCFIKKQYTEFYKDSTKKDKLSSYCRVCRKSANDQYRQNHKIYMKVYKKDYYIKNKEEIRKKQKKYNQENKEQLAKKKKEYIKKNIEVHRARRRKYKAKLMQNSDFKLKENLRNRIRNALYKKDWKHNSRYHLYIGCSTIELRNYLESKFQPGMTWDNYGRNGWEIDHIYPLSLAKTQEEMYKLCHYTNLQPLWVIDNIKKGNKICQL